MFTFVIGAVPPVALHFTEEVYLQTFSNRGTQKGGLRDNREGDKWGTVCAKIRATEQQLETTGTDMESGLEDQEWREIYETN